MIITAYIIAYIASYLCARAGHYILSGIILVLTAIALYVRDYLRTKNIINLRGLFTLGFLGGEGISCLKLSYLQTDWDIMTWISFFIAFIVFYLVYELLSINRQKIDGRIKLLDKAVKTANPPDIKKLMICTIVLSAVSLACFVFEAAVLGYIPLFVKGVPHAYSYFHISGVHYFTVSCVIVPSLCVIWMLKNNMKTTGGIIIMILCALTAFAIPLLCVSRFQFVFAVAMAAFTFIVVKRDVPIKLIVGAVLAAVAAFAVLSVARSHDAGYLNSIFEMKVNLPVDVSRVYIYIANNYDNFDCMVRQLPAHTMGLKLLFPVWALTGLKFVCPQLVSFPLFLTKEELTTLTLFYDFYYDFGVLGVFIGSGLIGTAAWVLERLTIDRDDPMAGLFYAQFAIYMMLSFFTTWFSNPTTWFYLAVTAVIYLVCRNNKSHSADISG